VWSIAIFDGRQSVTLPAQYADRLPSAGGGYQVSALELPDFDANSFTIDNATATVSRISADTLVTN
jgi:hypothetical protein